MKTIKYLLLAAAPFLFASCAPTKPAPVFEADGLAVEEKPEPKVVIPASHRIRAGETLVGIALEYGLDYQELALWNGISNPNLIHPGEVLQLSPPKAAAVVSPVNPVKTPDIGKAPEINRAPSLTPTPRSEIIAKPGAPAPSAAAAPKNAPIKNSPAAAKYAYSEQTLKQLQAEHAARAANKPANQPAAPAAPEVAAVAPSAPEVAASSSPGAPSKVRERFDIKWSWPAAGRVVQTFSDKSKGLDIAGEKGAAVYAAADGKVVYVGSGVKSYGRLIIVKHKNDYLSAYAHNEKILVREGERVSRGKQIATIGDSGAAQVMLHLEIRKAGKPLDPLQVLPPKP